MAIKPTTQNIDLEPSKWSTLNSVTPNFKKDRWYRTLFKVATFLLAAPLAVMIDLIKRSISYLKTEKKVVDVIEEDPPARLQKVKNFVFDNKKKIFAAAVLVGFGIIASKVFLKIPTGIINQQENPAGTETITQVQKDGQGTSPIPGVIDTDPQIDPKIIEGFSHIVNQIDNLAPETVIYPPGTPDFLMV